MSKTDRATITALNAEIAELEPIRNQMAIRIARSTGLGTPIGEWDLLRFQVADQSIREKQAEIRRIAPAWLAA